MANDSSKGPADETVEGSWSPRTRGASSTRVGDDKGSGSGSGDGSGTPDTDQLVDDIEKTRVDLAETLDAIADKVSPKNVVDRKKQEAKDSVAEATETAKAGAHSAAEAVKAGAHSAAEAVKGGVEAVREKVEQKVSGDDSAPVRSPLGPATSVEVDAATPVTTTGALADNTVIRTEPAGADAPSYTAPYVPASSGPSTGAVAGAAAAVLALLVVLRRRKRRTRRWG